jgi:hypothetical protein
MQSTGSYGNDAVALITTGQDADDETIAGEAIAFGTAFNSSDFGPQTQAQDEASALSLWLRDCRDYGL